MPGLQQLWVGVWSILFCASLIGAVLTGSDVWDKTIATLSLRQHHVRPARNINTCLQPAMTVRDTGTLHYRQHQQVHEDELTLTAKVP